LSFIIDEKIKVMVCGMTQLYRSNFSKILSEMGIQTIETVADHSHALQILETENFDWLIMDTNWRDDINAFNLLKLIAKTPSISQTKVSFLVTEEDMPYLSFGFELGVVSWHPLGVSYGVYQEEFLKLQNLTIKFEGNARFIAGTYLSKHLKALKHYDDLTMLWQKIIYHYPESTEAIKWLGEAMLLSMNGVEGKRILAQASFIDPINSGEIKTLLDAAEFDSGILNKPESPPFKFNNALLISDRGEIFECIAQVLSEFEIDVEHSTSKLWYESFTAEAYDIVILDWDLKRGSAPLILDQLLDYKFSGAPVIGYIENPGNIDINEFENFGFAAVIEMSDDAVLMSRALARCEHRYLAGENLYTRLRWALRHSQMQDAQVLKSEYINKAPLTESERCLVEAWFASASGEFTRSLDFCYRSLEQPANKVQLFRLFGKALAALKQFEKGVLAYHESQLPSLKCLGNLFARATVGLSLKKCTELDKYPAYQFMVGVDNGYAMCLSGCRETDAAINRYVICLSTIPEEMKELRSIVAYSAALCFARSNFLLEARAVLTVAFKSRQKTRLAKVKSLDQKLASLIAENNLYTKSEANNDDPDVNDFRISISYAARLGASDNVLRYLYCPDQGTAELDFLTKNTLEFKHRRVISRDISLGLEKSKVS